MHAIVRSHPVRLARREDKYYRKPEQAGCLSARRRGLPVRGHPAERAADREEKRSRSLERRRPGWKRGFGAPSYRSRSIEPCHSLPRSPCCRRSRAGEEPKRSRKAGLNCGFVRPLMAPPSTPIRLAAVLPATVAGELGLVAAPSDILTNQALRLARLWRRLAELRTWRPLADARWRRPCSSSAAGYPRRS
jgi:hypothetical protein